jgi:hypothetical protein
MKRVRRQSMILNNFFTLASIIIIAITIILYTKYIAQNPTKTKIKEYKVTPLSCEQINYSKSKLSSQTLLDKSITALNSGFYKLDGGYIKSQYSKSIIEEFITLDEVNSFYKQAITIEPKKDISKFLTINYEIIEADKKHPKNKDQKFKLYSGSIKTSFRANAKEIFSFYTDFTLYDKQEILERINCTIKVYKNHAKHR